MNILAEELNAVLANSVAGELLSDFGRRIYFPKGIVTQSSEAKRKASRYNATIGIATNSGSAMNIGTIFSAFREDFVSNDLFAYAPPAGEMNLRQLWRNEMIKKNPSLAGKNFSLPIVTSGLTHGISLAASLFLDKGDSIIVPDMYWGNYNLIFNEQREATMITFPLFLAGQFNIEGLSKTIDAVEGSRCAVILTFPNNPTGYTPTVVEAQQLIQMLTEKAQSGKKLLVIIDDAYFGLIYEEGVYRESLFANLCNAHENLFVIKADGATKEEMAWGFRIGFLTFGAKGLSEEQYEVLIRKSMGTIRGSISSCSKPAQTILYRGMTAPGYQEQKAIQIGKIKERYHRLKESLKVYQESPYLRPLPFNSGYFMAFECSGDAEALRLHLLDNYQLGTISIKNKYLRLTFAGLNVEEIDDVVQILYQGAQELFA